MLPIGMTRFHLISAISATLLLSGGVYADSAVPSGNGIRPEKVDFERHVMGLFGRLGCNAGSCHGSFQGKGGFRLSLFGYDPEKDYLAVTRDSLGRRIDLANPDRSLLLLKPTGQVDHGGGRRFSKDSWQYGLLRQWITLGASWTKGSGTVRAITITPPEYAFARAGEAGQLTIRARFDDGSQEDITQLCDFRTNDDAVAEVTPFGQVKSLRPGDTSLVVSYRGNIVPVRILVPAALKDGSTYPAVPANNYIDAEVFAKLRRLNIVPSDLATDAEFLRRVTIDTIGSLPSPDDVRAFLASGDPEKRAKKIDELLTHPLHAALWATKFSDITGNNTDSLENPQQLRAKRSQMWHDWFRKRVAQNMPYDEIVHGVLCATSREGKDPELWIKEVKETEAAIEKTFRTSYADRSTLDLFWRRQQAVTIDQWGEKTAAAFMGVRLECAQCHKHPFDRWTQVDYRAYANLFGKVAFGTSPEAKKMIDAENAQITAQNKANGNKNLKIAIREVFVGAGGGKGVRQLPHPDTLKPLAPKALGGPEIAQEANQDPRETLFDWLRSPDNPFFARSFVNRVWGHYFGVGIVDPVDNFSLANPPSNEKLLDALAQDFIKHHFDIRHLEREVLLSRTYQLSSTVNETNRFDRNNYSHCMIRPMMAEVVVDVINTAVGVNEPFGNDAPPSARAIEVGASRLANGNINYTFRIFGRPPRTSACDCERALEPALPQKLYMMADPTLVDKIGKGRIAGLIKGKKQNLDECFEELVLSTLSRLPTDDERRRFATYHQESMTPQAALSDALWALLNTREFILNH